MYRELGNFRDADIYIRRALEMRRRLHGPDHATVGMSLANLGRLRLFQNNIPEAVKYSLDGLKICEAQLPPTHPAVLAAQMAAGGALAAQGKYADASPMLDTVAGAYERMLPAHDARLAETYMWRGIARSASDKNSAREDLQRALATFETVLGHQAPLTVRTQAALAAMPDYD
jgi:tetratricopeptide (TPR) repeat protein